MALAVREARAAAERGEVPVGAVVAVDGSPVPVPSNRVRETTDPTAHAGRIARGEAGARAFGRLDGATLFSTVEPCAMCAGAALLARVARVVYLLEEPKFGGCVSLFRILDEERANHRVAVERMADVWGYERLLKDFFEALRRGKRRA